MGLPIVIGVVLLAVIFGGTRIKSLLLVGLIVLAVVLFLTAAGLLD